MDDQVFDFNTKPDFDVEHQAGQFVVVVAEQDGGAVDACLLDASGIVGKRSEARVRQASSRLDDCAHRVVVEH